MPRRRSKKRTTPGPRTSPRTAARPQPAKDLKGRFISRAEEANRLAGVVAHPMAPVPLEGPEDAPKRAVKSVTVTNLGPPHGAVNNVAVPDLAGPAAPLTGTVKLDTVSDLGPEEASPEEMLEMLQRVFREADLTTKRAFVSWVGEYVQLHADQGLWREEY